MISLIISIVLGVICIVHLYIAVQYKDDTLKSIKHTLLALFFLVALGIGAAT